MDIAGKLLEYENENGENYRLLFGIQTVTWESATGSADRSFGTNSYGAIEITPNILFISWSMDDGKVVSMVADFQKSVLHCCNTHEGKINFWKGNIKSFAKAPIDHA